MQRFGCGCRSIRCSYLWGVFTAGHVKGKGLDDVVHVVKPGGLACFSVNGNVADDSQYEFHEKMNQLSEEGKWKLISK